MKKIKRNEGFSLADLAIAIIVISIFTGVIASLYIQISYNTAITRMQSVAYNYAIQALELADKLDYSKVDNSLNNSLHQTLNLKEGFDINMDVEKYASSNSGKKDIIKTVNVTVSYNLKNENFTINLAKLKIREPEK